MTQSDRRNPQQRHPEGDGPKKLTVLNTALGVFAGVLTVLSAYLAFQTAQLSKEQKQSEVAAQSAGAQASTLQGENQQLQQQNDDLRSQLGAPSASTAPPAGPNERHGGQVTVAYNGPPADLDAPKSDSRWGTNARVSAAEIQYGNYSDGELILANGGQVLSLGNAPATYDSCTSMLGYSAGGGIEAGGFQAGQYFCLKTDKSRYSAIKLLSVDKAKITFDVMTYDPPFA